MRSEVRALPELFLDRLKRIVPLRKWDDIANMFTGDRPTTFRVNTVKTPAGAVREALEHLGFRLRPVSWYPEAFILMDGRLRDLQETQIYQSGSIYVQSLSSMIPPLVLNPQPGEHVLDLTAAPGSKTTQMVSLMRGEGEIVAVERNRIRYEKLKANLNLQGAVMVKPMLSYGESIGKRYPAAFDRVLVDAPCSTEGRFNVREPASYRYWAMRKIHEMAWLQKKLLSSAVLALRTGGVMVYSTCTFAPEENEAVVSDILSRFDNALELENIESPVPNQMRGLRSWEKTVSHPSIGNALRILPTSEMEAFFIARFRKLA